MEGNSLGASYQFFNEAEHRQIAMARAFPMWADDFETLSSLNLKGFLYVPRRSVKQMLTQNKGGSVVSITSSTVVNPIAGGLGSVPMKTKGGIEAITRTLAIDYTKEDIRFNAIAPGIVDTPMHANGYDLQRQRGGCCLPNRGPQCHRRSAAR